MKELFIQSCKLNDPYLFYNKLGQQIRREDYNITDKCKYCGKDNIDSITYGYWTAIWSPCHESCRKQGFASEAYECQKVDADCNDCKFFKRQKKISNGIFKGDCLKYNKETFAYPNLASGRACFIHRKD